jgi:hypothetical protein
VKTQLDSTPQVPRPEGSATQDGAITSFKVVRFVTGAARLRDRCPQYNPAIIKDIFRAEETLGLGLEKSKWFS